MDIKMKTLQSDVKLNNGVEMHEDPDNVTW